jgi:hypothetical protein
MLDDEFDRLKLLVWFVETRAFTCPSARSTLEELLEMVLDVVLIAVRSASTLDDELERERLDV